MLSLVLVLFSAAPAERTLVWREWYPGFLSPAPVRKTYTLTLSPDGGASLVIDTVPAPLTQRRRFNPAPFAEDAGTRETLEGSVKRRGASFTARFPAPPEQADVPRSPRARVEDVVLTCAPKTEVVHVAGARVKEPQTCSPCYERCSEQPVWTPPATTERAGVSCRVQGDLSNLGERAFFTEDRSVEKVRGGTDCPPEGLRVAGPPRIDASVLPDGTTAVRDVTAKLAKGQELSRSIRTFSVTRKGTTLEVNDDGVIFRATSLDAPAVSDDGRQRALSCWKEKLVLHSADLSFAFGPDACDGHEERPKSRKARPVTALRCLQLGDDGWVEPTLVLVPGRSVERLEIDTGCTRQRAVYEGRSFLPAPAESLDAGLLP